MRRDSLWLCILLLVAALPVPCLAGVRLGAELGVNYSTTRYDDINGVPEIYWDQPGWRPSFTGGFTLEIPVQGRFELVTGLRYVQQGNQVKFDIPADAINPRVLGEFRLYHDYLSVPALITWHPVTSKGWFVALGPEVSFLRDAHSEVEYSEPDLPSESMINKDMIEDINVMIDASAGYEFPLGRHLGVANLRYTHGLTNVPKQDEWSVSWKTQGVELLVGMRW